MDSTRQLAFMYPMAKFFVTLVLHPSLLDCLAVYDNDDQFMAV